LAPSSQYLPMQQTLLTWLGILKPMHVPFTINNPASLTYPVNAQKTLGGQSNVGVNFITCASAQLDSTMVSFDLCSCKLNKMLLSVERCTR